MGTIVKWEWDFGDGVTSTARSPFHIYRNPDVYDVTLTAYHSDGRVKSYTQPGYIRVQVSLTMTLKKIYLI